MNGTTEDGYDVVEHPPDVHISIAQELSASTPNYFSGEIQPPDPTPPTTPEPSRDHIIELTPVPPDDEDQLDAEAQKIYEAVLANTASPRSVRTSMVTADMIGRYIQLFDRVAARLQDAPENTLIVAACEMIRPAALDYTDSVMLVRAILRSYVDRQDIYGDAHYAIHEYMDTTAPLYVRELLFPIPESCCALL